jgi:hypothetical protein
MTRLGIITNPRSRQNRKGFAAVRDLAASARDVLHVELESVGGLDGILRRFAAAGVEVIAVNGGDGTVHGVLTALCNGAGYETMPPLAVLHGGMTNLMAHDIGISGRPSEALEKLLRCLAGGVGLRRIERPLLSIDYHPERPTAHGMFFGSGVFYRASMLTRQQVHPLGAERSAAVFLSLLWFIWQAIRGGGRSNDLFRGEDMALSLDGTEAIGGESLALLTTTLDRLILGIQPFWGDGGGRIRYTVLPYPARRLARAAIPILLGRCRPWMGELGYLSGRVNELEFSAEGPMVLDGEVLIPREGTRVRIRSDRTASFVTVDG